MRVIIAEDSLFVREGLVRLLTTLGHEVAGTAEQAGQVLPLVGRHQRPGGEPLDQLTDRERDVLALMAEGLSDQGIADRLTVALSTVVTHTGKIFRKLGIESPASNRRVSAVLRYLARSGA